MKVGLMFEPPTPEQLSFIRKQLGTTEQDIKDAVSMLRTWIRMQPHLPDAIDEDRIEHMYINCKCSMERTKRTMDAYFSLKHKVPELLMNRDPRTNFVTSTRRAVKLLVMPRLTPQCIRVLVATHVNPDASTYSALDTFKTILLWAEVALKEDCSLGDVIVFDCRGASVEHVLKTGVNNLRAVEMSYRTAYCRRALAIHLVSESKVLDKIVTLLKTALPKKLGDRIMTHMTGSTSLLEHIPAEYLPNEFGGKGGPAEMLEAATFEKVFTYRQWFMEQDQFLSDESKRPPGSACISDPYGVDGSFKRLIVD